MKRALCAAAGAEYVVLPKSLESLEEPVSTSQVRGGGGGGGGGRGQGRGGGGVALCLRGGRLSGGCCGKLPVRQPATPPPSAPAQIIANVRTPRMVPLRVDFGGGWLDVPKHGGRGRAAGAGAAPAGGAGAPRRAGRERAARARAGGGRAAGRRPPSPPPLPPRLAPPARPGGFTVNCAVSPLVGLRAWPYHIGGGLGGSAAHAALTGRDAVASELALGVGWQARARARARARGGGMGGGRPASEAGGGRRGRALCAKAARAARS